MKMDLDVAKNKMSAMTQKYTNPSARPRSEACSNQAQEYHKEKGEKLQSTPLEARPFTRVRPGGNSADDLVSQSQCTQDSANETFRLVQNPAGKSSFTSCAASINISNELRAKTHASENLKEDTFVDSKLTQEARKESLSKEKAGTKRSASPTLSRADAKTDTPAADAAPKKELPPREGRLTDITSSSSNKKRKLWKPESNTPTNSSSTAPTPQADPSSSPIETRSLSRHQKRRQNFNSKNRAPREPVSASSSSTSTKSASRSPPPPKPIPAHLSTNLSTSAQRPRTPDTGGNSPSTAYAALSLAGEIGSEEATTGKTARSSNNPARLGASKRVFGGLNNISAGGSRSASPAKRTRAEMEIGKEDDSAVGDDGVEDVSMVDASHGASASQTDGATASVVLPVNSKVSKLKRNGSVRDGREMSVDMLAGEERASSKLASEEKIPPIDEQIAQVMAIAQRPMFEGMKGYIISKEWLDNAQARGTAVLQPRKDSKEADTPLGAINNTNFAQDDPAGEEPLVDEEGEKFVRLQPGLSLSTDIEIIPEEAWNLIIKWYGHTDGSPVIKRYCHNTSTNKNQENLLFELYPPVFYILKLPDQSKGVSTNSMKAQKMKPLIKLASRYASFQKFLKEVKRDTIIEPDTPVRVWRLLASLNSHSSNNSKAGIPTPAQSRSTTPVPTAAPPVSAGDKLVIDINTFASVADSDKELLDANDESPNSAVLDKSNLEDVGLGQEGVLILEERITGPAGGEWVSDAAAATALKHGVTVNVIKSGRIDALSVPGKGSRSASPAGVMTRGRQAKNGRTHATVGLGNLGNTCYMNSALQCVRSVQELTIYFLENAYKSELNRDNPLGNHGEVATAYAGLLKELFKEGSNSHYAPRHFKQVIGKYGPSFSGYGQQDSQEFLLFLLDGLQEDLNRIKKKPYIEKPDSTDEMVHNQVALMEMADKCWDIYRARNDSVITDLFAGMYKSTVVCPVCDKVSIIFDPFNNLTLQLPIENTWCRTLFFFPLYSSPVRILVDIGKNDSFAELKRFVSKRVDVDPKRMIIAEIYKNKIYKVFSDKKTVGEERITDSDVIGIFELESVPSNYPAPLRKVQKVRSMVNYNQSDEEDLPESSDSPFADNILTTVLCRVPRERQSKFDNMTKEFVGMPTFITVNREEAMDHDAIFKKVLAKIGTCTTTDLLHDISMDDEMDIEDSDTNAVIVNAGDEDSSSDSKVQATSVQSEDGMVDISMKDVDGATATNHASAARPAMPRISYPPNMSKNPTMTKKQRFLDSKVYIPGDAASRRLFDLNVYHGKEWFPLGFQGVADNSEVSPLGSNTPEPIAQKPKKTSDAASKLSRRIANGGSATSSDEDELVAENPPPLVQNTGSNSDSSVESDEDDDELPSVKQIVNTIPSRSGPVESKRQRRLKKKAGLVTYGKRYSNSNIISRSATVSEDADSGIEADSTQSPGPQPLIRLGDVIILDWTREAFNSVFGGESNSDDLRGTATYEGEIPLLPDPALDAKRAQRSHRKRNGISLDDCLDEFGREEILSENDAWYCPRCKEHRRASKKFELWKAPDILVIHLKRFAAHGRLRDKLDVHVNFPVEGLDLSDRVVVKDDGKDPIYDLFAVDNHYGGLGGGHYTAYAKNFFDGEWYDYNDSSVSRVQAPKVVTPAAYLLFYRRRSPPTLGGPFFEQIVANAQEAAQPLEIGNSQSSSRAVSPGGTTALAKDDKDASSIPGEGQRLADFSRLGSSSASRGAAAARQVGGGGQVAPLTRISRRDENEDTVEEDNEDELPVYQDLLPSMENDGVGLGNGAYGPGLTAQFTLNSEPQWSFTGIGSGADEGDEDMDNTSTRAADNSSDDDDDELVKGGRSKRRSSRSSLGGELLDWEASPILGRSGSGIRGGGKRQVSPWAGDEEVFEGFPPDSPLGMREDGDAAEIRLDEEDDGIKMD